MKTQHVHFSITTPQQRKLLFETWQETGNVTKSCQKAHVGRTMFYNWKPRFEKDGYAGLEKCKKTGAPKGSGRVAVDVEAKVLALSREHTNWGKHRLANEVTKGNNWVALVSPNTVRRILEDAGMWKASESRKKKANLIR